MDTASLRFLIIDKHPVVRMGLQTALSYSFKPASLVECANGAASVEMLQQKNFDFVILDPDLPGTDVRELIEKIKTEQPAAKIIIFTGQPENIYAPSYFKAGVDGFVPKSAELSKLDEAIQMVANNEKYATVEIRKLITDKFVYDKDLSPFENLTNTEIEVTRHLATGKRITDIAETMHLHTSTIGTHKSRVFKKLNISNIVELRDLFILHNSQPGYASL